MGLAYLFHLVFWLPFLIRGQKDRMAGTAQTGPAQHRDTRAAALVAAHVVAIAFVYVGIALAGAQGLPDDGALVRHAVGMALIVVASSVAQRTLAVFRSWRLRAELTASHELSTDGPFRYVRHPIYTAMDLLCIGTLVWLPHWSIAIGTVLVILVGDLRARSEERLLLAAFGERYRTYMERVKRKVPGVY